MVQNYTKINRGDNMKYKTWGNNKFHNPELCKNCQYDTCGRCSNGPRGNEYRRAIAEQNIKDYEYRRTHHMDWNGLEE